MTTDLSAVDVAWQTLARAAAERPVAAPQTVPAALAEYFGLAGAERASHQSSLAKGLQSLGLHWIEVRLTGAWYRRGIAPLVAFTDTDAPIALLPMAGGYRRSDSARRLSAAEAAKLRPVAWQVYPPLTEAARASARGLVRFAARGAAPDVRFLLVTGLLAALVGGAMPFISGWLITRMASGADAGGAGSPIGAGGDLIWWTAALLLGLVVGNALLLSARNASLVRLQGRLQLALEPAVWGHLLSRDVRFLEELGTGTLVQRANAVTEMRRALSDSAASAVLGSAFGMVSLSILVAVDPVVGGCVVGVTAIILVAASAAAIRQQRHEMANREEFGRVASFLHSCLMAIEKIQVAAREERVFAGWAARYARQRETDAATLRWQAVVAGFGVALQPAVLATLGVSVALLRPGLSLGTFVAASIAVGQFAASAGMLQGAVVSSFSLLSAYRRLRPVLTAPADVRPGAADPGPLRGRVELHDVTFTYPGTGRPVLDQINITAEPGEFIAVVGPSGAGKSTLIRLLLGLAPPSAGAVRYDGRALTELDVSAVRAQLGVVLQQARAVRGSIVDNVLAGAEDVGDARVWQALGLAGLADDVRAMPMGLHTMVSEDNAAFSGGQVQRLMLARALVKQPPVLVLDEATSALDNTTQSEVSDRIAALDVTRIVVAHRLSTIRAADRIYVLDNGAITAAGTYADLLLTCPLFARLVARQEVT
jgi:ABC-type bacteriocin/lantibiotic exporter with double-glycine peptidase domain